MKTGLTILVAACVGLAIGLMVMKKQSDDARKKDADAIIDFSNQLTSANANLDELRQVNLTLTNDLAASQQQVSSLSNSLADASNALADTKSSLQSAQSQITSLNDHVADLESQNQELDQRANSLSNTIAGLNVQIAETRQKLSGSETNNSFLAAQLKQELAEREELERKFNDLNEVRAQVRKLHDDLIAARRLQWMQAGTDPMAQPRGGQLLMQHNAATAANPNAPAKSGGNSLYDLNVVIGSDGSVQVTPKTNAPAH
ncbi:MAG TPA: hypothetical protein VHG89_01865 [Verrucomicrobiae bacterium]|nr:hypothetical protein [Verrucomicrobiae bacterium]